MQTCTSSDLAQNGALDKEETAWKLLGMSLAPHPLLFKVICETFSKL